MKKNLFYRLAALMLFCLPLATHAQDVVPIDTLHFPDAAFREDVKYYFDKDENDSLSREECDEVTIMYVNGRKSITDLKGVEYFPNLTYLNCDDALNLSSLDVSQNPVLGVLYCSNTSLTSLDVSNNPVLEQLSCENTLLTSLDVSHNPALEYLNIEGTQLSSLDLSHNSFLEYLDYGSHSRVVADEAGQYDLSDLPDFDVDRIVALVGGSLEGTTLTFESKTVTYLYAANFKGYHGIPQFVTFTLESTSVSDELKIPIDSMHFPDSVFREYVRETFDNREVDDTLDFDEITRITSINISGNELITDLKGLEYFPNLTHLNCSNAINLSSLDVSQNPLLMWLICWNTNLTSLDVSHNPALETLNIEFTKLSSLDLSHNSFLWDLYYGCSRIVADEAGQYDLRNLPDFDTTRVSDLRGGSLEGTILTFESSAVSYRYATGYTGIHSDYIPEYMVFTLLPMSFWDKKIPIDAMHFPDSVFREYVRETFDHRVADDTLDFDEIARIASINISGDTLITDLKGIEYFPVLTYLFCDGVLNLSSLDVSHNPALLYLDINNTQVTGLDVSQNPALLELRCWNTNLSSLDVSHNPALVYLDIEGTKLTSLDVSQNLALMYLYCGYTALTSLDISRNPNLIGLYCDSVNLTTLDVSRNPALYDLSCEHTNLTSLDVSQNPELGWLNCSNTNLTSLDVSQNPALMELFCENTNLTSLDVSRNPALRRLNCGYTALTSLDVNHNPRLVTLECSYTCLTSLDLSQNSKLSWFSCDSSSRVVKVGPSRTFDLTKLPAFDVSRAADWQGGTVTGDLLTFHDTVVTYTYKTMSGNYQIPESLSFQLVSEHLEVSAPTFVPESGTIVQKGDTIRIVCATEDAEIYYGEGKDAVPTLSYTASAPIITRDTTYLTARALVPGVDTSATVTVVYYAEKEPIEVASPTFMPISGSIVEKGDTIRIVCATEDAEIYYGEGKDIEPTQAYTATTPILITADTTYISAVALIRGEDTSAIVRAVYYVLPEEPEDPDTPGQDTIKVYLPEDLKATVSYDQATLSWGSQPDYIYQLKVQSPGAEAPELREIPSAGAKTTCRLSELQNGIYQWAVRVMKAVDKDTLTVYVEGESFEVKGVGIEPDLLKNFRVYPNPNNGTFQVDVPEAVLLEILSSSGGLVLRKELPAGKETLRLESSGIYLLRLTTKTGQTAVKRVIVR